MHYLRYSDITSKVIPNVLLKEWFADIAKVLYRPVLAYSPIVLAAAALFDLPNADSTAV